MYVCMYVCISTSGFLDTTFLMIHDIIILFCFSNNSSYLFLPTKGITSWNNHSQISLLFNHLQGCMTYHVVILRVVFTNM